VCGAECQAHLAADAETRPLARRAESLAPSSRGVRRAGCASGDRAWRVRGGRMALLSAPFARADRPRGSWRVAEGAILSAALLLVRGVGPGLAGQTVQAPEYQVKAVFLFNFAQFVDWPPAAFPDPATPLVIGILGNDPFEGFLEQTIRGEQVRGRGLQVRRYHSLDEIKTCHILFISRPEGNRPEAILAGLRNSPILTVSDADGFAERGGMIRFVTDRNHIRLTNEQDVAGLDLVQAVKAPHLQASPSYLLT